jgi:SulP family sulfate permease
VPNTHFYRNRKRFEDVLIDDEILIVRFDAQLHFANTSYFKDKLQEFAAYKGDKLKVVIIDGESMNSLDSSAVYALNEMLDFFTAKRVEVVFTGLKGPVRDIINKSGLIDKIGFDRCFMSIQEAIDCYENVCKNENKANKFQKFIKQSN